MGRSRIRNKSFRIHNTCFSEIISQRNKERNLTNNDSNNSNKFHLNNRDGGPRLPCSDCKSGGGIHGYLARTVKVGEGFTVTLL